jgi:nucleotide-binding universal stress UspA family protein
LEAIMGMKTILVLMEKYDGMKSVLQVALLLARRYGSYVEGVPLRWATPDFPLGDIVVAFPVEQYEREIAAGALFESGRPLLLCPPSPPGHIGTNVLIAWNGSTEQARAIALAMPLLERAERVIVLTVTGGTGVPGPSAEQMIKYLQRNEVPAEPLTVALDGKNTGEAILAAAQTSACDLLIKGAFTQSRLRQMIFGGATQHVMAAATLPVLLAH